jgi:hypothetical protein
LAIGFEDSRERVEPNLLRDHAPVEPYQSLQVLDLGEPEGRTARALVEFLRGELVEALVATFQVNPPGVPTVRFEEPRHGLVRAHSNPKEYALPAGVVAEGVDGRVGGRIRDDEITPEDADPFEGARVPVADHGPRYAISLQRSPRHLGEQVGVGGDVGTQELTNDSAVFSIESP